MRSSLRVRSPDHCMSPSAFASFHPASPVLSQVESHAGASAWALPLRLASRVAREKAATAGTVRYRTAMKASAHPAVARASRTFGTVKKRTRTLGSPAVPTMSAVVTMTTSSMGRWLAV